MLFLNNHSEYNKVYDVLDISRFIINYTNIEQKTTITLFKLYCVFYFLQAESMVKRGKPLFREELTAVDFGPTQKDLWKEYRVFGAAQIPTVKNFYRNNIKGFECKNSLFSQNFRKEEYSEKFLQHDDRIMITGILDALENYSSNELFNIIRSQKPWKDAIANSEDAIITPEMLLDYFSEKEFVCDFVYSNINEIDSAKDLSSASEENIKGKKLINN